MASISRSADDAVVIAGAVLRGILDMAMDAPGVDDALAHEFYVWQIVGGISLDLLEPHRREQVISALSNACARAMRGERAARSGDDVASGERLRFGAEAVADFLGRVTFSDGC